MIRFGAAQRPLRTGRCRVRELRCSFTIATFSRNEIRAASDLAVFLPAIPAGLPLASRTGLRIVGDGALAGRAFARFDDNYKRMNELSKDSVSWLTVDENATGQRIDNFLLRILKGVPKSHVYRILRSGEVRLNKGRVGPDVRLTVGDVVRVPPIRTAAPPRAPIARSFKPAILFEDEWLIAVDKPAGLAVHGGSGIALGLIEQLRAARPDARFLELAHRLDRDTSGVLLVARKRAALTGLHAQLREGHRRRDAQLELAGEAVRRRRERRARSQVKVGELEREMKAAVVGGAAVDHDVAPEDPLAVAALGRVAVQAAILF